MRKQFIFLAFILAVTAFAVQGCRRHEKALRVELKSDGALYNCPAYIFDEYFSCDFDDEGGGFIFNFCRDVISHDGERVTVMLRVNEESSFELNRPYELSGSASEGGNYAVWDWTFKSTDGYVTFLNRWDDEDASYISGRFEFTAVDEATGRTVEVTEGIFENLSTVL